MKIADGRSARMQSQRRQDGLHLGAPLHCCVCLLPLLLLAAFISCQRVAAHDLDGDCWRRMRTHSGEIGRVSNGISRIHGYGRLPPRAPRRASSVVHQIQASMDWVVLDQRTQVETLTEVKLVDCDTGSTVGGGDGTPSNSTTSSGHSSTTGSEADLLLTRNALRSHVKLRRGARPRRKRKVHGDDDREKSLSNRYPYASVVQVQLTNAFCTGTLISPRHVLTAGHCLYDHGVYKPGYDKVKVGLVEGKGFRWLRVKRFYLPRAWLAPRSRTEAEQFDFAVLELGKCLRTPYMKIASVPHDWILGAHNRPMNDCLVESGLHMHMTAFASDKGSGTMWNVNCKVAGVTDGMFVQHCDAMPGSSGAALYTFGRLQNGTNEQEHRLLRGVFLGLGGNGMCKFNVAMALTEDKAAMICHWTNACDLQTWESRPWLNRTFKQLKANEYRKIGCKVRRKNSQM